LKLEKAYLGFCIHKDSAFKFRHLLRLTSTPMQREAEDEPNDEKRVQKKRAAAKQRQWIEN
jgi:hypothetical protein